MRHPARRLRQGLQALLLGLACITGVAYAATTGQPYIPTGDDTILQRVPATTDPRVRRFQRLRAQRRQRPDDLELALKLARAYIDYARGTGDARYLGRALAALQHWTARKPVPVAVMIVHATILQSRHQFDAARRELKQALQRAPGNAQGWLTLATVDMVQGQFDAARSDCVQTANTGGRYLAILCNGALLSLTGQADKAYRLLSLIEGGGRDVPAGVQAYVQGLLAAAAARTDRDEAAEQHYRKALQLQPGDNFLLTNYSDFLLDRGRPGEVIALVEDHSQSDTLFLRQALAEAALDKPGTDADIRSMAARFDAMAQRGSHVYRRAQARFVLELQHEPKRALALAQKNWRVQRAPEDIRIFLQAALAADRPQAAAPVLAFLARTHLQDPRIEPLATRLRSLLPADQKQPEPARE